MTPLHAVPPDGASWGWRRWLPQCGGVGGGFVHVGGGFVHVVEAAEEAAEEEEEEEEASQADERSWRRSPRGHGLPPASNAVSLREIALLQPNQGGPVMKKNRGS